MSLALLHTRREPLHMKPAQQHSLQQPPVLHNSSLGQPSSLPLAVPRKRTPEMHMSRRVLPHTLLLKGLPHN
jgi:hypothetical protein